MSRTETKGERKRTIMQKQNNSNSSYLVEEVTPQLLRYYAIAKIMFITAKIIASLDLISAVHI